MKQLVEKLRSCSVFVDSLSPKTKFMHGHNFEKKKFLPYHDAKFKSRTTYYTYKFLKILYGCEGKKKLGSSDESAT